MEILWKFFFINIMIDLNIKFNIILWDIMPRDTTLFKITVLRNIRKY